MEGGAISVNFPDGVEYLVVHHGETNTLAIRRYRQAEYKSGCVRQLLAVRAIEVGDIETIRIRTHDAPIRQEPSVATSETQAAQLAGGKRLKPSFRVPRIGP